MGNNLYEQSIFPTRDGLKKPLSCLISLAGKFLGPNVEQLPELVTQSALEAYKVMNIRVPGMNPVILGIDSLESLTKYPGISQREGENLLMVDIDGVIFESEETEWDSIFARFANSSVRSVLPSQRLFDSLINWGGIRFLESLVGKGDLVMGMTARGNRLPNMTHLARLLEEKEISLFTGIKRGDDKEKYKSQ